MRSQIQKAILRGETEKIFQKVKKKALKRGIFLASITSLYKEIAKTGGPDFAVPAFNIRTLTFDAACSVFRAAKKAKASAFILEIASSEMEYTNQAPEEFSLCVLGAAIKEKYKGPIFLQGDHFHLKDTSPQAIAKLENLILSSLKAGFYNIDIDCSALIPEDNIKYTNYFIDFIRKNQPQGIEVAIGGEVNSIGGEETTKDNLEDFLKKVHGLAKVSCQTGTKHGGEVLASGEIGPVSLNFENIEQLGNVARQYGLAGIVQHGASTLQQNQFAQLAQAGALEIHLSTLFQDIILDSRYFPKELKNKMYSFVEKTCASQAQKCETNLQFLQIFRKKSLGEFKKEIWSLPKKNIKAVGLELEEKFIFFFKVFSAANAQNLIKKIYY